MADIRAQVMTHLQDTINHAKSVSKLAFDTLQSMNVNNGDGQRWCSARQNYEQLRNSGINMLSTYERYVWAGATEHAAHELIAELERRGFWEHPQEVNNDDEH